MPLNVLFNSPARKYDMHRENKLKYNLLVHNDLILLKISQHHHNGVGGSAAVAACVFRLAYVCTLVSIGVRQHVHVFAAVDNEDDDDDDDKITHYKWCFTLRVSVRARPLI